MQTKSANVKLLLLLLFSIVVPNGILFSQSVDFDLDLNVEPVLRKAQIVELITLTNPGSSGSSRLITIFVSNASGEYADDLYLDIDVSSTREGVIMESFQRNNIPFGLANGESAAISNIDIANGRLPNIREKVMFDGRLTSNGRSLLNSLQGMAILPPDEYTVEIRLYKRNNSRNGGIFLATASATVGENLIESDMSVYLLAPGDQSGSGVSISNPYPEFRWEGVQGQNYRLILVEEVQGEDPQSLIESARSTPETEGGTGNLLEYEYLDLNVDGRSFQYPSFGSKPLADGKRYYWQVFSDLQSASGITERASELWSFTMRNSERSASEVELGDELMELLIPILGVEKTDRLSQEGYSLIEIEIDGQTLKGEAAKVKLMELLDKMRSKKIKLTD